MPLLLLNNVMLSMMDFGAGLAVLILCLEIAEGSNYMSLHYFLDVIKDSLDYSFNSMSTTLEVTWASGLLHLSIDQKCHFLLGPECRSKQSERNPSALRGSGAFHIILASLPYLHNIEKNMHIQNQHRTSTIDTLPTTRRQIKASLLLYTCQKIILKQSQYAQIPSCTCPQQQPRLLS